MTTRHDHHPEYEQYELAHLALFGGGEAAPLLQAALAEVAAMAQA